MRPEWHQFAPKWHNYASSYMRRAKALGLPM